MLIVKDNLEDSSIHTKSNEHANFIWKKVIKHWSGVLPMLKNVLK